MRDVHLCRGGEFSEEGKTEMDTLPKGLEDDENAKFCGHA